MKRALGLALLSLLAACPRGPARIQSTASIDDYRRAAADAPERADLAAALAVAEMLHSDGDPLAADGALRRALTLDPNLPELHYLLGVDRYAAGKPSDALDAFIEGLERALLGNRQGRRALDASIAEIGVGSLRELLDLAPRFSERVQPVLRQAVQQGSLATRVAAASLLAELGERRGEPSLGETTEARAAGCLTEWRVAGPVGPRALLGFDAPDERLLVEPFPDSVDLGPGRGVRPVRTHTARACTVHLGDGPVPEGGDTYAESAFEAPRSGAYTFRLETPNAVELRVDGERIARLDARREPLRRVTFHTRHLGAGPHRVSVLISTRHPNPILSVAVGEEANVFELPDEGSAANLDESLGCYLSASAALARGRVIDARQRLRSEACGDAPVIVSLHAAVALSDPFADPGMARDRARQLLRRAAARDPRAWFPQLQLARLEAAEGRDREAILQMRTYVESWPEVISFRLALSEMLLQRGWDAEAGVVLAAARTAAPDSCRATALSLGLARQRDRVAEADRLTEATMACDARSPERFRAAVLARDWAAASAALDVLASFETPQARHRLLQARLELAEGRGEGAGAVVEALRSARPRSDLPVRMAADRRLARGDLNGARHTLAGALRAEPASMADLRQVLVALGGDDALSAFRLDGEAIITEFEASERAYDAPQVLVLDYTAARVFEDGSSLVLTHEIFRAQSEESVDALGEFHMPEGGRILRLETRKADGQRLEPELIDGTDVINLPTVSPGDYVEREYVRVLDPPSGLAGGVLGDRFYFRSDETPFHRSELVVAAPRDLPFAFERRGDAPAPQRSTLRSANEELQVIHFGVSGAEPVQGEPLAVNAREFTPSVNWGIHAEWPRFFAGLRDLLADRDPADPAARALARRVTDGAESDEERARRLHRWVLEEIEDGGSPFGLAPQMVAARSGHRARVLHYLMRLVNLESELLLSRGANNDQTASELADEDTYANLVVRWNGQILMTTARSMPFGYVVPGLRNQEAVVLLPYAEGDAFERTRIPDVAEGADRHRIEIIADVLSGGAARLSVMERYQGHDAVQWRENLEAIPAAELNDRFEEAYAGRIVPGAQLTSLRVQGQDEFGTPLTLRYELEVPGFVREGSDGRRVRALFAAGLTAIYATLDERQTTLQVGPAIDLDVMLTLRGADGAVAPEAIVLEGPGGARFEMESEQRGDELVVQRRLRLPMMRVTPDDYAAFAAWVRRVDEADARELAIAGP